MQCCILDWILDQMNYISGKQTKNNNKKNPMK